MGFGLPTAIGAALAFPERQVVLFTGDGRLQVNEELKLEQVINHGLELVAQHQGMVAADPDGGLRYQ